MNKTIPIVEVAEDEQIREDHLYDVPERDVLVLNYTLACPLSCNFCCYGCHPRRTEKMPLELALGLIDQAGAIESFSSVGLTGGEVFMHLDDLFLLARRAASVNLPFTVATAAHWANSRAEAERIVSVLSRFGLRRANISCDPAHQEFVPVEYVENAVRSFSSHGIRTYIVGTFDNGHEQLEDFLPNVAQLEGVSLRTKRTARVGRATKRDVDYSDIEQDPKYCYRRQYHDVVVFWDGSVYPCCSTFNRATKGLVIGNAFSESLKSIWMRLNYSSLFRTMKSAGYLEISRILAQEAPELFHRLPELSAYPGPCSYCNTVLSNTETTARLREFFCNREAATIAGAVDELSNLLGEEVAARLYNQHLSGAVPEQNHGP